MGSTSCPGPGALVRRSMVSTSCPRRLKRCSTGLQGRPPEPGDSRIGPRSHGVYQLSQATPSRFPGPTVLTSSSGRLILGSDGPWGCPELRGDSRPCPRARGVDQMSRETFARVKVVRGRPAVPPESGLGPKPCGVDQLSRVIGPVSECARCQPRCRETPDLVRGSAWSTRHSGDSGPCLRLHGFNQHPEPLWTVLGAAVLNSCPRELALGPRVPGVDQRSRATPVRVGWPTVSTSSPGTHARV